MGDPGQSAEDQNSDKTLDQKGQACKVSNGNSVGNRTRDHVCFIRANKLPVFC